MTRLWQRCCSMTKRIHGKEDGGRLEVLGGVWVCVCRGGGGHLEGRKREGTSSASNINVPEKHPTERCEQSPGIWKVMGCNAIVHTELRGSRR